MAKILFLLDYPRLEYQHKNGSFDYGSTSEGKRLKESFSKLGLKENVDYRFAYAYNQVPEPDRMTKWGKVITYKSPSAAEMQPWLAKTLEGIIQYQPEVVVPMGTLGTRWLLGKGITFVQGTASETDIRVKDSNVSYHTWVLPIYNQRYIEQQPNLNVQRELAFVLLKSYLEGGTEKLVPARPGYVEVKTMEQARELLALPQTTGELAWDLETTSLHPNNSDAKVLIFSFSWAEGHGAALPLEHNQVYQPSGTTLEGKPNRWTKGELDELYTIIRDLLEAKKVGDIHPHAQLTHQALLPPETMLVKVGHNIKFDEHFLMAQGKIDHVNNVLDTLTGYFLEVSQDSESSKRLSDLAYTMTPIGGYDEPLEQYKTWLLNTTLTSLDVLKACIGTGKDKQSDYQLDWVKDREQLEEAIDWSYLDEYGFNTEQIKHWVMALHVIPEVNRVRKKTDLNKTGFYTYEWIPMQIMYYYAAGDADAALRIHHKLMQMIDADPRNKSGKLKYLYTKWYPRLIEALAIIQNNGLMINQDYVKTIQEEYNKEAASLIEQMNDLPEVQDLVSEKEAEYQEGIKEFAKPKADRDPKKVKLRDKYRTRGTDFSPTSNEDVPKILIRDAGYIPPYDKLFVKGSSWKRHKPENKLTWEDYSTGKDSLANIKEQAEKAKDEDIITLTNDLQEYSKVIKAKTAFADRLGKEASDVDKRIHGLFNATGTATSRLSASNPRP